jgi:hypothetical protein
MQRGNTPRPSVLLFARRSTAPTAARRYRGPRRGQGRSTGRGLHLPTAATRRSYQAAAVGRNPQAQTTTHASDALDIFIRRVLLGDVPSGRGELVDDPRVGLRAVGGDLDRSHAELRRMPKNAQAAWLSRHSETRTSIIWPRWSIARYR